MLESTSLTVVESTDVVTLDTTAKEIGLIFAKAKAGMVESVNGLVECGRRLIAQKEALNCHGSWLPWLEANEASLGFGRQTAARLMAAARKCIAGATFEEGEALQISRQIWGHVVLRGIGSGTNEWYTPPEYIELARNVLGSIDLDPASHPVPQQWIKAKKIFTKEDDGLAQKWKGRVWLNPPYSMPLIYKFIDKLLEEIQAKRATAAVLLTHNCTDTLWFDKAVRVADAVCFTKGRVRFLEGQAEERDGTPPQGQAFCYFGDNVDEFIAEFSGIGNVLVRP